MADSPDYFICLNCESPCYNFEWEEGKLKVVLCDVCGADDVDDFATQEDLDALASAPDH